MANNQMIQTEAKNSTGKQVLYISLELSNKKWKLTFGDGQRRRERTITSADLEEFKEELVKARKHFRLDEDCAIYSCYESGRDGFWIHRYLESIGIKNIVVDSASIEVEPEASAGQDGPGRWVKVVNHADTALGRRAESLECGTGSDTGTGR